MGEPLRIIVADDHPLYRDALVRAVRSCFAGASVEEADSLERVLDCLNRDAAVDLVVLDLKMPDTHGFSGLSLLRSVFPAVPVAVVSAAERAAVVTRAMRLGAAAFVPKSVPNQRLQEALRAVVAGETWVPSELGSAEEEGGIYEADRKLGLLTAQQLRVLHQLSRGLLNKQIAHELGVAEATVKSHVTAIMRKLGVNNRTQAVLLARDLDVDSEGNVS